MKKNHALLAGALAILALFSTGSAQATPVAGTANIAGNVNVSGGSITFMPTFTSTVDATETGDFAGLLGGTILSLTGGTATGSTLIPAFATFTNGLANPVFFDLTYISAGVGTLADCESSAPGAACTPAGSPFTLFQLPSDTVIAALQLSGNLYTDSSATGVSSGVSIFSTQANFNGTIPEIVAMLENGESLTGITYSASFASSPVPEPASLLLFGIGLVGAGVIARRKAKL